MPGKRFIVVLSTVLVLLFVSTFFLPAQWSVEHTTVIAAPPEKIFPYLDDIERWWSWSKTVFDVEDPEPRLNDFKAGPDAMIEWRAGSRWQQATITAALPQRGVWYDLVLDEAIMPKMAILFRAVDGGTEVTWNCAWRVTGNPFAKYQSMLLESSLRSRIARGLEELGRLASEP